MIEEAIRRVKECFESQYDALYLGGCGLSDEHFAVGTELDQLLRKCTHIRGLYLTRYKNNAIFHKHIEELPNRLTLPPDAIRSLCNLTELCCRGDRNTRWEIENMSFIANLTQLKYLDIGRNRIRKIEGLERLRQLRVLILDTNEISKMECLDQLSSLHYLEVAHNSITKLEGLEGLPKLGYLNCANNQIPDLKALVKLPSFVQRKLEYHFYGNPLKTPPPEIYAQGPDATAQYFKQLEKEENEVQYLFEEKVLVVGEGGTGKTSFICKMKDATADLVNEKNTTLGIDVHQWKYPFEFHKIPGRTAADFHINFWDFGGQKIYQGTHQMFFDDKALYVLVADTREQQQNDFPYWLNTIEQLAGDASPLLIVLNKKFGHVVKFDSGYQARFHNIIRDVVQLDLKNDTQRVLDLQLTVKNLLRQIDGIGDPLPPSWVAIRQELALEREAFIPFDRFREICKKHGITDAGLNLKLRCYEKVY